MLPRVPLVPVLALAGLLSACATVQVRDDWLEGGAPLCSRATLGAIAVLPETRWRPDQKEPAVRQAIAQAALTSAFRDLPCGRLVDLRPFATYSAQPEPALLSAAASAGIDTVIFVRVEELGPQLLLSVPVLWSGYSDVKLQVRALAARTGVLWLDVRRRRTVGGPFELRGLGPLQGEMETLLRELLGVSPTVP